MRFLYRPLLLIGVLAILGALVGVACTGEEGPVGPVGAQGAAGPPGQGLEPQLQTFDIIMGEGEIIQEVNEEETLTGEFHRWEPAVLVVNKGDTVQLHVTNPRGHAHSFALPDFGVITPRLERRGGTAEFEFVADKAGVFQYLCGLPYDEAAGNCDPDHQRMVGYLIVLNR